MDKLLKFTSRNHITDRWLQENPEVMIECWYCGKLIHKDDPRRKYCDSICKKRYWRASRRTVLVKSCGWCYKAFEVFRKDTIYCSKKCIRAAERERRGIPVMGTFKISCGECGILFIKTQVAQKYCSFRCFMVRRLARKRAYNRRARGSGAVDKVIEVSDNEIAEATENLKVLHALDTMVFDEDDWSRRAKEAERRIAARFATT